MRDVRDYTLLLSQARGRGWSLEGVRVGSNGRGERPHNGPFRRTAREGAACAGDGGGSERRIEYISYIYMYILSIIQIYIYIYLGSLLSTLHN